MNNQPPDSLIDLKDSRSYWESIDADVNGMLGGFPSVSKVLYLFYILLTIFSLSLTYSTLSTHNPRLSCSSAVSQINEALEKNKLEVVANEKR